MLSPRLRLTRPQGQMALVRKFYQKFSSIFAPVLLDVFTAAYDHNILPPTFYSGHTVLIPKTADAEKLRHVEGYRPISLCNVDYKIFAKILSRRLQFVITSLVGSHQTCGTWGRSIHTNIHIARSVLECVSDSVDQVALIQIDLAKAFDRVSHDFLFALLAAVNLGDVLYKGIKLCYDRCSTQLIVNRILSEPIAIKSSVRQGCPLSPLLFALYLEPLCLSIQQSEGVKGFCFNRAKLRCLLMQMI